MERATLLGHAKKEYAASILEGVGKVPALTGMVSSSTDTAEGLKESWALKQIKNPYRLNEKQKSFLVSKFNIGQDTGQKMDPEVVAKEMRREKVANGKHLFATSEFVTPGHISLFFSRLAEKIRQQPMANQSKKTTWKLQQKRTTLPLLERQSVLATFQLVHPIICDQQIVCELVKADSLAKQKLGQVQFFYT